MSKSAPASNSCISPSILLRSVPTLAALAIGASAGAVTALAVTSDSSPATDATRLITGKRVTPEGTQTNVGSFPANLVLSPDGQYILVTNTGAREYLSVLRASDGQLVSQLDWNAASPVFNKKKQALYYGLVCGRTENGLTTVYASRGAEGTISILTLSAEGVLKNTGTLLDTQTDPKAERDFIAGLALSADGSRLYATNNTGDPQNEMRGGLDILDLASGKVDSKRVLPGYPFAVAALKNGKVYASSEQRGTVSVLTGETTKEISTGTQPVGLLLDRAQKRLFVANAGSDTISIVDTATDKVTRTILLRPDTARGLPGATPIGLALSPDEKRLFVTLADMNAVAVVDLGKATLSGYIPVGWYPTALAVSPDGKRLFVANAKGVATRNPNGKAVPGIKERPQYIQNIIEGTVSTLDLGKIRDLKPLTAQVLANNLGQGRKTAFTNPDIKHVFYLIKENRTYDQVLGDLPQGNGDPNLVLFGREVTPNLHALAERFVLLDNFYCCAEVSGDGWNWSTGGMASEYTERNVPHNYGGRQRPYDFEGTNNGVAVDRLGIPDAARPPGGYIWDLCAAHNVSLRNYGFFTDDLKLPRTLPEEGTSGTDNSPSKKALLGKSSPNFRQFDMTYADSEAWIEHKLPAAPKQMVAYGEFKDPSRITAWKREFAEYVKNGNLPAFNMLRVPRDHTSGTTEGASSPRAMVADNDYAVGQIVETISRSPYWKSSAIVIVEDDAQNGYDHVDAHRSIAFVISPFIEKGRHDSRFYNTDSALRTIEGLLGLPPMNQYDALAAPIDVFSKTPVNDEPYSAILPAKEIIGEVNTKNGYKALASARMLNPLKEESAPDEALNEILWHSIKGNIKPPERRYSLSLGDAKRDDDDN